MNDFGIKRQRVSFVRDVCVHSCKHTMGECFDVPSSSGISGVRVIEEPAGTHERKPDRTTGEMLLAVGCRDDGKGKIINDRDVLNTCNRSW